MHVRLSFIFDFLISILIGAFLTTASSAVTFHTLDKEGTRFLCSQARGLPCRAEIIKQGLPIPYYSYDYYYMPIGQDGPFGENSNWTLMSIDWVIWAGCCFSLAILLRTREDSSAKLRS